MTNSSLQLHILGTGTPTPTPDRFGSAFAVQLHDRTLLFDCGPSTTHKLVKAGLWPTQVTDVFFTHHHFDHNADFGAFLLTRWDQNLDEANRLQVFGPSYTTEFTERLVGDQGAFCADWRARIEHPASQRVFAERGAKQPRRPPMETLTVQDCQPGVIARGEGWQVTGATADHAQPWLDSLAYRLDVDGFSIVFTGDTGPCAEVAELARGADLMLCMCWTDGLDPARDLHGACSALGAGTLAEQAGVGELMLVHTGPELSLDADIVCDVARDGFSGVVSFASELTTRAFEGRSLSGRAL